MDDKCADIESAISVGKITAYVLAVLMCVTVVARLFPAWWLGDAVVIAGIGFGIGRRSRLLPWTQEVSSSNLDAPTI